MSEANEVECVVINNPMAGVWYLRDEFFPPDGIRILALSPQYEKSNPMRLRVLDSQFICITDEVVWWTIPQEPDDL